RAYRVHYFSRQASGLRCSHSTPERRAQVRAQVTESHQRRPRSLECQCAACILNRRPPAARPPYTRETTMTLTDPSATVPENEGTSSLNPGTADPIDSGTPGTRGDESRP